MIFSPRKLYFLLRTCSALQSPNYLSSLRFPIPVFFSCSSSAADSPSLIDPFIADYLINSVEISPEQAIKGSGSLFYLQSTSKPYAVCQFFKNSGFSDVQIKKIISKSSRVLLADVDTLLKPRMEALKEFDFSDSDTIRLVSSNPTFLFCSDAQLKRINLWWEILQSKDLVLNALLRGSRIIFSSTERNIMPKIQFLRSYGISQDQIAYMFRINPTFVTRRLDIIRRLVKRVEELRFPCGSRAFCVALISISQMSRATMDSKLNVFRNMGCSEAEISLTILKCPQLLTLSAKNLKNTMDFLVKNAGFETSYVMERPLFLTCSLENRLIPRYHLLQFLKSKDLLKNGLSFFTITLFSEKKLMEKLIVPYQEEMPELRQIYAAALAGKLAM
ncbi:hypothetical protein AXF42_Ash017617 [Apostasia shenzhenica]|uniref:Uncharacterized protein n=1 Tax=Apostasia shenzhenica TaxID=1088818 RepID=A0A2I0A5B2_9ASPA|nr:hypothetical protein AXF42_Ash017617 [Apostasia shenzhenica]